MVQDVIDGDITANWAKTAKRVMKAAAKYISMIPVMMTGVIVGSVEP